MVRRRLRGSDEGARLGWAAIAKGESALVFAPTGSGKTLAAFLAAIDRLIFAPLPTKLGPFWRRAASEATPQ